MGHLIFIDECNNKLQPNDIIAKVILGICRMCVVLRVRDPYPPGPISLLAERKI